MMHTEVIVSSDAQAISIAQGVLARGGLVAFPTDTVYGLAAGLTETNGIARIYEAKARLANKAIAVLLAEIDQLALVTTGLTESAARLAHALWPGALTLVVPARPDLPPNLSPLPTVGVRMPDHAFARALMRVTGPLATSSANISGDSSALNAHQVLEQLDGKIELVIDGGPVAGGIPSTVVDCTQDPPRVLRQGGIPETVIWQSLNAPHRSKFSNR